MIGAEVVGVTEFTALPDLAGRAVGGAVLAYNDAFFAGAENLLLPHPPARHDDFGQRGKVYDGWETRRRRSPGTDWVVVRLGVPGVVAGVVVDTSFFTGNYPVAASLEGLGAEGHPTPAELAAMEWEPLLPESELAGDTPNAFRVTCPHRLTHVRLTIHPDGGVARLRVHGTPVADPRPLDHLAVDLAALENGGVVTGASNAFYSKPTQLIAPGTPRNMGEGWETARRRGPGNDWVTLRLAGPGVVRLAELDTTWFLGNAPGSARLTGRVDAGPVTGRSGTGPGGTGPGGGPEDDGHWVELLPRTALLPDTRHRFVLDDGPGVTDVRLDVYPDGGMARLRLWGTFTPAGRTAVGRRWFDTLPDPQAAAVLAGAGLPDSALAARPTLGTDPLDPALAAFLDGPT